MDIFFLLIFILIKRIFEEVSCCLILNSSNSFGGKRSGACFEYLMNDLKQIIVHSNVSVVGFTFIFLNGTNTTYVQNLLYSNNYTIDLSNSNIIGVRIFTDPGVQGLQFQFQSAIWTQIIGQSTGCSSTLDSNFLNIQFFQIISIQGCIHRNISTYFKYISFSYSFSKCPLNTLSTTTTTTTITNTSTTTTTATTTTTLFSIISKIAILILFLFLCLDTSCNSQANFNKSLFTTFSNSTRQSNITSINGNLFNQLLGFEMYSSSLCNNASYLVIDKEANKTYIMNDNWSYVSYKIFNKPAYLVKTSNLFYMSGDVNVWKLDENLNVLMVYNAAVNITYRGLYFNSTNNFLYVAPYNLKIIHVFDSNITLHHSFSVSPFQPFSFGEYNNLMYIGTKNGSIVVILNETIIFKFPACNQSSIMLTSILFDHYGYMATSCNNYQLYLYNSNGTFMNMSFQSPNEPRYIGYDSKGRFFLISFYQISIYN
jgi:hypothetical protein